MKQTWKTVLVTRDEGLLAHWQRALGKGNQAVLEQAAELFRMTTDKPFVAWIDLSLADLPVWNTTEWRTVLSSAQVRIVATSSNPNDTEGMAALDAGCAAYCHAFSDAATLRQVREVVDAGHVWIGRDLMQRLLRNVNRVATQRQSKDDDWEASLTQREIEIATLAANGASNAAISSQCQISERTVKAHLSAVFLKLNVTDRLQLALRVHGIH